MADGCHVLRPVAGSQAVEIFVEHHVKHPVQAVLDGSVAARGTAQGLGMERMVADEGPLLPVFLEVRFIRLMRAECDVERVV